MDPLAGKEMQAGKEGQAGKELPGVQSTQASQHEEAALSRDVYALLAQANLLRVRGQWEEAAEACMAALRLAPDSSSANSLLGDIYENQGRYDDAAQWYRMALDANPDSPADRVKLDRLRRRGDTHPAPSRLAASAGVPETPKAEAVRGQVPRFLRDPELALRWGAIAAAVGLVLVVSLAFRTARHAGSLSAFGLGRDVVVKPVVVPPRAGTLPVDPDAAPAHDPSEQALLTALQGSPDLSRLGVAVYDVQADPRAGRMTVTFSLPSSPGLSQAGIARDALQVFKAAGPEPTVTTYTARCLLVSSSGQPSSSQSSAALAFIGDASSASVQASAFDGAALTDSQAEAAFSNLWWSSTADIRA